MKNEWGALIENCGFSPIGGECITYTPVDKNVLDGEEIKIRTDIVRSEDGQRPIVKFKR